MGGSSIGMLVISATSAMVEDIRGIGGHRGEPPGRRAPSVGAYFPAWMRLSMRILYQVGCGLLLLVAAPFWLVRRGRRRHLGMIARRLGLGARAGRGSGAAGPDQGQVWLHAVSVGEVGVAATLARSLPGELPLLLTTVTPTGQERARQALAGRAEIDYLPFDLGPPIARFFARHQP